MTTFEEARRKARYGPRDWITYRDKSGATVCERISPATIKAALLAGGTQGRFTVIAASTGICYRHSWRIGLNMLRNFRHIYAAG